MFVMDSVYRMLWTLMNSKLAKKNISIWNIHSWGYDMAASNGIPYQNLIKKVVAIIQDYSYQQGGKKMTIVDACCGTGNFSVAIKNELPNATVLGIDFTESMLKRASYKNSEITYILADLTEGLASLEDSSTDVVLLINGFYPQQDKKAVIRQIYRVLHNEGILILSDPCENASLWKLLKNQIANGGFWGWTKLPFFIGGLTVSLIIQMRKKFKFYNAEKTKEMLDLENFKIREKELAYAEQNYLFVAKPNSKK